MPKKCAEELAMLAQGIKRCEKCPLYKNRTHAVPGEGNPRARILLIGEAPGATEDKQGRPFVGPAGRFLDVLLEQNGLKREEIFITNSVKCRPPDNRFPSPTELTTCKEHWLDRQLTLIDPEIVVLLGKAALMQLLGETGALKRFHGQVRQQDGRLYCIQYHPAAGLRSPEIRALMKQDFAELKRLIQKQKYSDDRLCL